MLPGSRIDLQAPNPKTNQQMVCDEFSDDALESLLATLHDMYGFDFRDYSRAHIRRRVLHRMGVSGLSDPAALEKQISTPSQSQRCFEIRDFIAGFAKRSFRC